MIREDARYYLSLRHFHAVALMPLRALLPDMISPPMSVAVDTP